MSSRLIRGGGVAIGVLGVGLSAGWAQTQGRDEPRYVSARELRAKVAKTTDGLAGFYLPTGPGAVMVMAHRRKTGEVEAHTRLNDAFVAQDGHATVLVGGRVEGNGEAAPGEWRGRALLGGQAYEMSPGDVLWIPAGVPHQVVVPQGGSFSYIAIKFELKPMAAER